MNAMVTRRMFGLWCLIIIVNVQGKYDSIVQYNIIIIIIVYSAV